MPRRFRRPRVLIVGCGDVGLRLAALWQGRFTLLAVTSSPGRVDALRAAGVRPLVADLDRPSTLARLAGVAERVVHLAPPPGKGRIDTRTRALVGALRRRTRPQALVYASTTGVYGDRDGAWVSETARPTPRTDRAHRRVDAEVRLRAWPGVNVSVLRVPGIYAPDRVGGDLTRRLREGTPVPSAADDVYTHHIHAEDLARALALALWRGQPRRVYNVGDETGLKVGDFYDALADWTGWPRPPRLDRAELTQRLSSMQMSFLTESRRLRCDRVRWELGLRLAFPTFREALPRARTGGARHKS